MSLYSAHSPCKVSYYLLIISEGFVNGEGSFPNASSWETIYTCSVPQSSFIEVYINEGCGNSCTSKLMLCFKCKVTWYTCDTGSLHIQEKKN